MQNVQFFSFYAKLGIIPSSFYWIFLLLLRINIVNQIEIFISFFGSSTHKLQKCAKLNLKLCSNEIASETYLFILKLE